MAENVIEYFNLLNEGDSATVRLLHSSVSTIEKENLHFMEIAGKKRSIKCNGEGCVICSKANNEQKNTSTRIFVHLYDYDDNKEKVWSRTDKILDRLKEIEEQWGNLNDNVLKITRLTKEFPKYQIDVIPAKQFPVIGIVDQKIAYRFYMTRSNEELEEFYKTGVMPAHKSSYVSKEEYFKNKETKNEDQQSFESNKETTTVENSSIKETTPFNTDDDPFMIFK